MLLERKLLLDWDLAVALNLINLQNAFLTQIEDGASLYI